MDPMQKAFEIHSWPFYHLARVTSLYAQKMDASLKPLGVDVPRWRVLALLDKNGTSTITQLAIEAVTKIPTMAKIIQRMVVEGFVTVQPSTEDARSTLVDIAPRGQDILGQVQDKVSRIARRALHDVSEGEIQILNRITEKIYVNLAP
jgi:DNA-binding MarR family transcriptional regulator